MDTRFCAENQIIFDLLGGGGGWLKVMTGSDLVSALLLVAVVFLISWRKAGMGSNIIPPYFGR